MMTPGAPARRCEARPGLAADPVELAILAEALIERRGLGEAQAEADGWFDAGSFQTREYTERVWSEHVEILEYAEGGMQNYQDLVVARRR